MGAAAIPIVGGLLQGGGSLMESRDKQWALEDEAIADTRNAQISREAGAYNAGITEVKAQKVIGGIEADYGYAGVSADSSTVLDVLRESHMNAELDKQNIIYGAELRAENFEERASAARFGAKREKDTMYFKAFSSFFGGASSGAMKYGGRGKTTSEAKAGVDSPGDFSSDFRSGNLRADTDEYNRRIKP